MPVFGHFLADVGGRWLGPVQTSRLFVLQDMRAQGVEPMALNSLIARLGTADPVEPVQDMVTLIGGFDMGRLGRAPARFDPEDVTRFNARILHDMPYALAAERLAELGAPQGDVFWDASKAI